ncbi:restriction endonuclease subunit S [Clostridium botulinum]|nr:hypothetical protein [Clostridium botulinum]APQ72487.1 type I restriction modification DNA specificity domain protein [Clostridium botulinum]
MYTLAATNMILRGDGSANIQKGNSFNKPEKLYKDFKANRLLLNPPFSYAENGMPFIAFGLDNMSEGGLGVIIIQDSAGNGKAITSNKDILSKHTLLASIKMPNDLFLPMAGVNTCVYVFEAHKKHDFDRKVKFINFRNDGYKRSKRGFIQEVDNPIARYQDIIKIYKAGVDARVQANWDLKDIYIEDFINDSGADWNFDQHLKIDSSTELNDFQVSISDSLSWEISKLLKRGIEKELYDKFQSNLEEEIQKLNDTVSPNWKEFKASKLFKVQGNPQLNKSSFVFSDDGEYPYFTRTVANNGISGYVNYLDDEHLIKGNSLAVGMLGMQFFYMKHDFYAGQFTKTVYPLFEQFNQNIAEYFVVQLNKHQKFYQGSLVRDFEELFYDTSLNVPCKNDEIDYEYMEKYVQIIRNNRNKMLQQYLKAIY